jgi:hypothetical protein
MDGINIVHSGIDLLYVSCGRSLARLCTFQAQLRSSGSSDGGS